MIPTGQSFPTVPAIPQASNSPALPGNNPENIHYMPAAAQSLRAPAQQLDYGGEDSIVSGFAQSYPSSQVRHDLVVVCWLRHACCSESHSVLKLLILNISS